MYCDFVQRVLHEFSTLKALFFLSLVRIIAGSEESVVDEIIRRPSGDIAYLRSGSHTSCHDHDQLTYVMDERECISNEDLLYGTSLIIILSR